MDDGMRADLLHAAGFRAMGGRAIRLDMLERLEEELEKGAAAGTAADELLTKLVSLLGCDRESLDRVLAALGWQKVTVEGETPVTVLRRKALPPRKHRPHRPQKPSAPRADSPFAELAALVGK
jgi:ATP-dependent RNA helicase SUPV3L1/SUV3